MKSIKLFAVSMVGCMFVLTSCSNEDVTGNDNIPENVSEEILSAFKEKYPDAENVSWTTDDSYAIASFYSELSRSNKAANTTAWFYLKDSKWGMTEHDIPFTALPDAVKKAFESSAYATWIVDDEVDVISRDGADLLYIIEAENKADGIDQDIDLYYTSDGILVKEILDAEADDDHTDLMPSKPANDVYSWLEQNYNGARIIEVDFEDDGIEVEFVYNNFKHEALLTTDLTWVYTKADYNRNISAVSQIVADAFKNSEYNSYVIDDIEFYQTASNGNFYCFELETRFDDDVEIYFSEDGEILNKKPGLGGNDDNSGIPIDDAVLKVINEQYPGAIIKEKDTDDGYLQVEIIHENIEKEVLFNGKGEWIRSSWEIPYSKLPQVVKDYAEKNYRNIEKDDVDVIQTPAGVWYELEVEKQDDDIKVQINEDGTLKGEIED